MCFQTKLNLSKAASYFIPKRTSMTKENTKLSFLNLSNESTEKSKLDKWDSRMHKSLYDVVFKICMTMKAKFYESIMLFYLTLSDFVYTPLCLNHICFSVKYLDKRRK